MRHRLIDPIEEKRKAYVQIFFTIGFVILSTSYFLYGVFFR